MSRHEFLRTEVADGIATVTLNRPPLNVLNLAMMSELNEALEDLLNADVAALLLRAEGKAFSAGVDVADHTADKVRDMIRVFHSIFRRLIDADALTIAAVQGAALGGGCELACVCDIVLASERARFGQPEVQVGVFPPVAACLLPALVGLRKAVEINALGETIDAAEAHRIGLVSHVYPADEFEQRVATLLHAVRQRSRPVVRLAKRATVCAAREATLAHLDRAEQMYLEDLMALSDAHEGIAAFLEKRKPVWKHA